MNLERHFPTGKITQKRKWTVVKQKFNSNISVRFVCVHQKLVIAVIIVNGALFPSGRFCAMCKRKSGI